MLVGIRLKQLVTKQWGGTVPTPDQSIVEELGAAVGLDYNDGVSLQTNDILQGRDSQRWELDPMSSEDYQEH